MRLDGVVPLGEYLPPPQPHARLLLRPDAAARLVGPRVQAGTTVEALPRPRPADVLQDRLVIPQRLARPVAADQAEHPVVDRVPLRRAGWQVGHGDSQAELVG